MLIHAKLPFSGVNGPGNRAVIWFQGCTLACPGCWNPGTHSFSDQAEATTKPEDLSRWILSCPEIEGVTFSGGEPFQQAPDLLWLCALLHANRPHFSLGVFTGYTLRELASGRWNWRNSHGDWQSGSAEMFAAIRSHLDFAVTGRFVRLRATAKKPLCGSQNQEVIFFTDRYGPSDLDQQAYEIWISEDGEEVTATGFPSSLVNIAA